MEAWFWYAVGSALFAGLTSILAKIGIEKIDSNVVTAVRTGVVLVFAWLMVFVVGSAGEIQNIAPRSLIFLILSGLGTGASWLCYFRALQLGNVNKVTPIDKSSTVITMVLAILFLNEDLTGIKVVSMLLIFAGTMLMIARSPKDQAERQQEERAQNRWLIYAVLSAVFASLTSILAKVGIEGVESNLGTAIRTGVVLIMAWAMVFLTKKQGDVKKITRRSAVYICLSGVATGGSWLCYYRALQLGPASVVVPIDKLSIVVTVMFSYFFLHEKLSWKALFGLLLIVGGTMLLLL